MGQQQNRMEGAVEPEQTDCERYRDFITRLNDYIEPDNPNTRLEVYFKSYLNTFNLADADKGKIKGIYDGILRDPRSGTIYYDLDTINYDELTPVSELLNMNLNRQNFLTHVTYFPDGKISGAFNTNYLSRSLLERILYPPQREINTINCDAEKLCTCIYFPPLSNEVLEPPIQMRSVMKSG